MNLVHKRAHDWRDPTGEVRTVFEFSKNERKFAGSTLPHCAAKFHDYFWPVRIVERSGMRLRDKAVK
jgi:hypothetical protein